MAIVVEKPATPFRDVPLFAHASGQWTNRIKGSLRLSRRLSGHPGGKRRPNGRLRFRRRGRGRPLTLSTQTVRSPALFRRAVSVSSPAG
jgi:hypothetical protein